MSLPRHHRDYFGITLGLVLFSATFITACPPSDGARTVTVALLALTLIAAVRASGADRRHVGAAAGLGGAAILAALGHLLGASHGVLFPLALSAVLVTFAPVALVRGMLREMRVYGVTAETVMGAIAVYLLFGMFFALMVGVVAAAETAPYFGANGDGSQSINLYFSFVTLATLGYGDFTPATSVGRSLAMLEGVLGQLYLVTIVSLLITNVRRRVETPQEPPPADAD